MWLNLFLDTPWQTAHTLRPCSNKQQLRDSLSAGQVRMCPLTSGKVRALSTLETPDWMIGAFSVFSCRISLWVFVYVTYRCSFYNCPFTHRVWKSHTSSKERSALTFDPAEALAVTDTAFGRSPVEGPMVIWSMPLNELAQPLTDVQCESSVSALTPGSVLTMNKAATIKSSEASGSTHLQN